MKYNEEIEILQIELLKMQSHVKKHGKRIALIFEGRDAAGKVGIIEQWLNQSWVIARMSNINDS